MSEHYVLCKHGKKVKDCLGANREGKLQIHCGPLKTYMVDGDMAKRDGLNEKLVDLMRHDPETLWANYREYLVGINEMRESTSIAMLMDDYLQMLHDAKSPAEREMEEIEDIRQRAEDALSGTRENGVEDGYRLRAEAKRRMAEWRERYPREAALRDADAADAAAEHEEHMASGAAGFSADGWLTDEDRAANVGQHQARAAELRAEAQRLRDSVK